MKDNLALSIQRYSKNIEAIRGKNYNYDLFKKIKLNSDGYEISLDMLINKKSKSVVVFIPGTNAYTYLYNDYLFALYENGHSVVAFDPRGHGQSDGKKGDYSISELLQDTTTVIEYVKIKFNLPIFLSGSSQGGIVSFYYGLKDASISGLICHNIADLSCPSSVALTRFPKVSRLLRPLILRLNPFFLNLMIPMVFYLDLRKEIVKGFKNAKEILYKNPFISHKVSLKLIQSLAEEAPNAPLEKATVPLFVLQAANDQIFKLDYIQKIFNRVGSKKYLKIYEGLPHYMIVDYVDIFIKDVLNFIDENISQKEESVIYESIV